jgi:hypothetical protein
MDFDTPRVRDIRAAACLKSSGTKWDISGITWDANHSENVLATNAGSSSRAGMGRVCIQVRYSFTSFG